AARLLLLLENVAHAGRVLGQSLVILRQFVVADAVFAGQAVRRRRPTSHLAGDLQEAGLQLLCSLVSCPRHLIEHLLEIDPGIGLECREKRRSEWRMGPRKPIERLLAELRRGHEQEALHGAWLNMGKRELLAHKIGADEPYGIVATGIEN